METVCRWDPSGLGWGWDPGAPLLVHCAHKLLDVRGQQVIHLVALDRTGWGQRLWVQGERWGDAVEQKERRKALLRWTSRLLALVDRSPTLSPEWAGMAQSQLRVLGHDCWLLVFEMHLTPQQALAGLVWFWANSFSLQATFIWKGVIRTHQRLWVLHRGVCGGVCAHQRGLTQQTAALAQAPQRHVEVSTTTTPAGDLGEGVGVQ